MHTYKTSCRATFGKSCEVDSCRGQCRIKQFRIKEEDVIRSL
jgi:hypothetical protein